jgi:hypothetical protein
MIGEPSREGTDFISERQRGLPPVTRRHGGGGRNWSDRSGSNAYDTFSRASRNRRHQGGHNAEPALSTERPILSAWTGTLTVSWRCFSSRRQMP